jgi:hypothetical protein
MVVYVLLFNARTENEGIHTLNIDGQDLVLMFEHEDDAIRYALMLEAQDFPAATAEGIDQSEIEEFCESAGYGYRLIPEGTLAVPPDQSLEQTTWNPDQPAPEGQTNPEENTGFSQAELDRMRQQFEKLL